jgi:site-specific recombinase XerD
MKNVELETVLKVYLMEVRDKAAYVAEEYTKHALEPFLQFLKAKGINVINFSKFGDTDMVEYYFKVVKQTENNEEHTARFIAIILKFITFMEDEGYIEPEEKKNQGNDSNNNGDNGNNDFRLNEAPSAYGSHCA